MTRDQFTAGFTQRRRNIRQKEERLRLALETLSLYGSTPSREESALEARINLDAAEIEFADFVFDALDEKAPLLTTG